MRFPAPLVFLLLCAGCAPSIQSAAYLPGDAPARPGDAPVRVYQNTRPACPVAEIGWVRAQARSRWDSPDDLLDGMRSRARAMGGDAIIALVASDQPDLVVGAGGSVPVAAVTHATVFRGTVARFTDPSCTT